MNVFISADIEGIGGIMDWTQAMPDGIHYKRSCEWMVEEVNAAIEGALEAGASTIVVKDSHGPATNIDLAKLHPAAELISGWGPTGSMAEGIDATFDVLFLIGYHARATTIGGTLAHTWSSNVLDIRINDKTVGEAGWAAAYAGHFGVPLGLIAGDDKVLAQVAEELPSGFHTVRTKTGLTRRGARMRPIPVVREELKKTAARCLADVKSLSAFKPDMPATLTLRFRDWENLEACEAVPGVERIAVDTFQCRVADVIEAQKYFITLHRLAKR